MNSLTDLVEKLREVEADRLVDVLRRMHNDGTRPDWNSLSQSLAAGSQAGIAPVRRTESVEPSGTRAPAIAASSAPGTGDDARGFFVDLEQKLRKQQSTADAVIGRLRARERRSEPRTAEANATQQLVSIIALAGTRAGGRFVVAHPGTSPARIELRVGELRTEEGHPVGAAVTLEPAVFELAARSRRIVKVTFDLSGFDLRDGQRLVSDIEAFGSSGRRLMRASVEIQVHREDGDAG
jgi:hypothetical protein